MGLESADTTLTDELLEIETYKEENTIEIAYGRWHTVVEKTFDDDFKVIYLRTEWVMILDYDFSPEQTYRTVEAELSNACKVDPALYLWVFKTPRGVHAVVMDRVFNMHGNNWDILQTAKLFPNRDLACWRACMDRLTWGARLTHKQGETEPVAQFMRSVGSGQICEEAKTVMAEYERLLREYA